jgi:hypothetical protein
MCTGSVTQFVRGTYFEKSLPHLKLEREKKLQQKVFSPWFKFYTHDSVEDASMSTEAQQIGSKFISTGSVSPVRQAAHAHAVPPCFTVLKKACRYPNFHRLPGIRILNCRQDTVISRDLPIFTFLVPGKAITH